MSNTSPGEFLLSLVTLFVIVFGLIGIHYHYDDDYVFISCGSNFDNNFRCDPARDKFGWVPPLGDASNSYWIKFLVNADSQKVLEIDKTVANNANGGSVYLDKCNVIDKNNWTCTDQVGYTYQDQGGHLIQDGGPFGAAPQSSFSGISFFLYKVTGANYWVARFVQQVGDYF